MQYSKECKRCPGIGRCKDKPNKSTPMELTCPICNGAGDIVECKECDDGLIIIVDCPLHFIGDDAMEYIRFVRLYDKGMPPILGGVLDQSNVFIEATEFIASQEAINESKQND